MADTYIQLPADSSGKKVRAFEITVGADDVYAEAVVLTGPDGDVVVDASGVIVQDGGNSLTVDGSVTANAGTNLNTSLLALEAGGNLATIAGKDFATQTTLALIKAKTDNLDVALSTRTKPADSQHVTVDNASLAVTGTFWQATQPVSLVSVPSHDVTNAGTFAVQADTEVTTADLDTGAGTDTRAVVGLVGSKSGGAQLIPGDATAGLKVDLGADNDVTVSDGGNVISVDDAGGSLTVDSGGTFAVQDSQVIADNAGFTDGTSKVFMGGYVFDEVAGTALTENDAAAARVDSKRAQVLVIEDATTRGRRAVVSSGGALSVDPGLVAVNGTVTANQGTGNASNPWAVGGNIVHDSVDSGNPAKIGGKASTGTPSAVDDGDRVNAWFTQRGRLAVSPADMAAGQDAWSNSNIAYAAAGGDNSGVGPVAVMGYNGTTWDRVRTANTGRLQVDVVTGPGTQYTEDAVAAGGESLTLAGSVRQDTPASSNADGDYANLKTDSVGRLWVNASGAPIPVTDNSGSLTVDNSGTFAVQDSEKVADNAGFTDGTTKVLPVGLIYDEVAGTALTENDIAAARINANRATVGVIEDGATRTRYATVTAANALKVDASGVAVPVTDNAGSLTIDAPVGTPVFVRLSDGAANLIGQKVSASSLPVTIASDQTAVKNTPPQTTPLVLSISGSIGITTAATWNDKLVYAVPASTVYKPMTARCAVTTAATRTLIAAGKQLATFNPGTNTFVATGSTTGNDFYDRIFYRVATTHSATATTVTITYTDQAGSSSTATAVAIPASTAGQSWFELPLAAGDFGVQSVTAVSDTANPTSVVDEIWGFRTLLEDLGPANTPHLAMLDDMGIPNGESIVILFNAAATTAQQRFASLTGALVAA